MAQILLGADYDFVGSSAEAGIIIVNTCGFIGPAKDESYQVLGELAAEKRPDQVLIAAGCLTQRYGEQVVKRVPGIDGVLGTRRWMDILKVVESLREGRHPQPLYHLPEASTVGSEEAGVPRVAIQGNSAYLKIADGCRRPCAFCAIPLIKGPVVSRPMDLIVEEAQILQGMGMREIILIAQDTTDYGHDFGMKDGLAELLETMITAVPEVDWIRVMYAFPGYITDRLIDVIAEQPQILPYLDIPLQHAQPKVLRAMRRPANMEWVYRTLDKMRSKIPDLAIRTTFILGYPDETEADFNALLEFIERIRFDRVGAFQYSFEPGTAAEDLGDPVAPETKQSRWERLMELQQGISLERNQSFVGKKLDVLIEGHGDGISIGRSYRDAPEIDGLVVIEDELPIGEIVPIRITGAMVYDLTGVLASEDQPAIKQPE